MVKLLSFATVLACVAAVATASTIMDNADTRNLRSAVAEEAAAHRHVHATAMEARGKNLNALHHHMTNAEMEAASPARWYHRVTNAAKGAFKNTWMEAKTDNNAMAAANADRGHRLSMEADNADRRHWKSMEAANADRGHQRAVMEAANADRRHRMSMEAKANNKAISEMEASNAARWFKWRPKSMEAANADRRGQRLSMEAGNSAGWLQRIKSTAQSWMNKYRGSAMEAKANGGFGSLAQLMKRNKAAMEAKGAAENDAGMKDFGKSMKKMMHGKKG